jgi:hypothetical protein
MAVNHARTLLIILLASLLGTLAVSAADIVVPPAEAPTTIFSTKLGSVDVDLSLQGSWTAAMSYGFGWVWTPGVAGAKPLDAFPGIAQGFLFTQAPDITISLDLLKRFFLDVSVLGDFTDNSIQLGYRGASQDVLRSVVLGTQGITIDPSQLLQIPGQGQGSLGAMARLASGGSTNDLLLRWDPAARKTKTFIGKNELVQQETAIDGYVRGRFFFLPDLGPFDSGSFQVFLEDAAGTFIATESAGTRKYRIATYDEVVLDSANGLVYLKSQFKGRVLVYYKKAGLGVGFTPGTPGLPAASATTRNPAASVAFSWGLTGYLGQNMIDRQVALPGVGACLLLWQPGDNSPFEIESSYAFTSDPPTDVSKISYRLNAKDSSGTAAVQSLSPTVFFQSDPPNKRFLVLVDQNLTGSNRFRDFFPFADPNGLLYGPQRDSLSGSLDYDIICQFLTPVTDLILEANIVPGSVQVEVNGVDETRFQVEPVSGKLTLLVDVNPTDRIDVSYSKAETGSTGGDVLFAWRDAIPISDALNLSFSAGLRWNANPWTYSQLPYAKSGTVIATAAASGKTDNLAYSAEAGISYTNPDTTGILRLFGMEGNLTNLDLSEDNAYPASAPVEIAGLSQANRGFLYYRDYRVYGALGSATLQPIEATQPALTPYANGSRMGPYNVLGSAGSLSTTSLVMEYALTPGQWVGTNIPISSGSDVDLSGARAITVRLRGLNLAGVAAIFLQVGSISEDLDGSGQLKAEASPTDPGFPFVDQAHGITLKVGAGPQLTGNAKLDSEDRNANGILDYEDSTRVVTPSAQVTDTSANLSQWVNFIIPLGDSDRQKLLQARGVRLVIQSTAGATGTILIDAITVEGTPFWPQTQGVDLRSNVHVQEVPESLAQTPPPAGADLPTKYPATYKLFHPNAELNEVLETAWAGLGSPFTVQGFTPQGTGGIQYQTIVSYVRSTGGATLQFSLTDSTSKGIVWSIATADNAWHEIKVSAKGVTVDGAAGGTVVRFDSSYGSLVQLQILVSGAPSGSLYVDEIYCTDPAGAVGAAFVGTLSAKFPGTLVKIGSVPVLSDVSIREDVSLLSAGFSPLYGIPSSAENLASRSQAEGNLLFTHAAVDVLLDESAGAFSASGGHRVSFPNTPFPITVTDAFNVSRTGGFSREDLLVFAPGPFLTLALSTDANADADESVSTGQLTQTWTASLALKPFAPLTVTTDLALSQAVSGYTLPVEWYGARWVREAALVLPWEQGGDVLRQGKLSFKAGIPAAPIGFDFEADTGAAGTNYADLGGTTQFTQNSELSYSLALLMTLGAGASATNLSVAYKRLFSATTQPLVNSLAPDWRFSSEAAELGRIVSQQGYLATGTPFVELFSDNSEKILSEWQSATAGTYSPSVDVTLQRSYGARLIDLFVPSSMELSLGQDLRKTSDYSRTTMYVRPRATTRAVNLFGELGAYPLFAGVRTDEYSFSLSGSVDGGPGQPTILSTLSAEAYGSLTGADDRALTLVETLKRSQTTTTSLTNDTQLLLDWKGRPQGGVVLPLIPVDIGKTGYFTNRESAEVTVGWQDTGTYHPFTFVLGHATTLVYEGHGTIKASANIGMDAENLGPAGFAWRLAVTIGLEAKLTF